jgi:nicotinamide-nucleotide amidase
VSARAGIVVTGTEVLTGRVSDLNGPWLAERLRQAGVDVGFTVVVGDRPQDLVDALDFLAGTRVDLVVTSGGLGPTADDLTAAAVGDWQGRPSVLDPALEARIAVVVERLSARRGWSVDAEATAAGTAKQARVPEGAEVLEPTGTAPGLVVPGPTAGGHPPVVVLPGPPGELQAMWPHAMASPLVTEALAGRAELRQSTVRLWATPEAAIAATLRRLDAELDGLEITTCLREGELEVVTRYGADLDESYRRFLGAVVDEYGPAVFSTDGSTVDDIVAGLLESRGLTIATAESCTAGLLAGRLTERAGSSAWVRGGAVVYANEVKHDLVGVPTELIERHGAVSEEVAVALAEGARRTLRADVGVGVTGIAGPGGGTEEKPVGLVHLCVAGPDGAVTRAPVLGGGRSQVRARAVAAALHLVRELLQGSRPAASDPA